MKSMSVSDQHVMTVGGGVPVANAAYYCGAGAAGGQAVAGQPVHTWQPTPAVAMQAIGPELPVSPHPAIALGVTFVFFR